MVGARVHSFRFALGFFWLLMMSIASVLNVFDFAGVCMILLDIF